MSEQRANNNETWLDGYRWALTHLNDPGVINDAATYLTAGVNDTAALTRTTATDGPEIPDESKGAAFSVAAPAPAVTHPTEAIRAKKESA